MKFPLTPKWWLKIYTHMPVERHRMFSLLAQRALEAPSKRPVLMEHCYCLGHMFSWMNCSYALCERLITFSLEPEHFPGFIYS